MPRTNQIVMAIVVGLVVMTYAGGLPQPVRPPETSQPSSSPRTSPSPTRSRPLGLNDPLRPLAEFWSLNDPGADPQASATLDDAMKQADVELLLATVPDPIDSRFGYRFDSVLDDIQMALESQGWNLDRFWLPWRPSGEQPNDHDSLDPVPPPTGPSSRSARVRLGSGSLTLEYGLPDPDSGASPPPSLPLHRREPGVLLFRKPRNPCDHNPRQQVLVLLLVGETPTEGLHKVAFLKALQLVDLYGHAKRPADPTRVRIIGPSFTGTEQSLTYVLRQWSEHRRKPEFLGSPLEIRVVSGSATRIDPDEFATDSGARPGVSVRFQATVQHSDLVVKRLLDYLRDLNGGNHLGRIALLTESDTQFGKMSKNDFDLFDYDVTDMKFPFHISQVAVAYDKSAQESQDPSALIRPSNKLSIPFDETGHPRDVIPALSPRMTAATDEFVMSKILETISNEDYRYVGIIATDTRDVIFLAGLIHRYCPDVQIFTIYGDMLLGHPEYASQLRGLLLASSYPLFSLAQRWDPPNAGDRRRHLFSQEGSQGAYNATLLLMADHPSKPLPADLFNAMYDYGTPFSEMADIDLFFANRECAKGAQKQWFPSDAHAQWLYRPERPDERPPLWFGVVGQRGIWPLGFETNPADWFFQYQDPRMAIDQPLRRQLRKSQAVFRDYIAKNPVESEQVGAYHFARMFIPLVPRVGWAWGTLFVLLTVALWMLYLALCRLVVGPKNPALDEPEDQPRNISHWDVVEIFRPRSFWDRRTGLVGLLFLVLSVCYGLYALVPAQIILAESSWKVFWIGSAYDLMAAGDRLNWWFCSVVVVASAASCFLSAYLVETWLEAFIGLEYPRPCPVLWARAAAAVLVGLTVTTPWAGLRSDSPLFLSASLGLAGVGVEWIVKLVRGPSRPLRSEPRKRRFFAVGWSVIIGVLVSLGALGYEYCRAGDDPPKFRELQHGLHHPLLFLERALDLGSGVSPMLPLFLLSLTGMLLLLGYLREVLLADRYPLDWPLIFEQKDTSTGRFHNFRERLDDLDQLFSRFWPSTHRPVPWEVPVCGLLLLAALVKIWGGSLFGMDTASLPILGWRINYLLWGFLLLILVTAAVTARFVAFWRRLARFLGEIARLPMLPAFDRIPPIVSRNLGRYLDAADPSLDRLAPLVHQWQTVCHTAPEAVREQLQSSCPEINPKLSPALQDYFDLRDAYGPEDIQKLYNEEAGDRVLRVQTGRSKTLRALRNGRLACLRVLVPTWLLTSLDGAYGDPSASEGPRAEWLREVERFVAMSTVYDINRIAIHLRVLASVLSVVPLLLIAASLVYPLQPQRFLELVLWGLLIGVVSTVIWVYIQMERNELLSRIARTTPNRVGFDRSFVTSILTYLLPLISLVLAQFPYVSDTLSSWFEPLARIAR